MKVLVFVKATPNSEAGILSGPEFAKMFAEMGKFNDRLAKAGIIQDADGLKPSSAGKRVKIGDGNVSVLDGPFLETKELVAGYWIWNVKSMDEAVEWAKQCPIRCPATKACWSFGRRTRSRISRICCRRMRSRSWTRS